MTRLTVTEIIDLWELAGGDPSKAMLAACVALAESGGDPGAHLSNTDGSIDRGLWQVNSQHGALSTYDELGNARAAIQLSSNGTDWKPWCTCWTDAACGTQGGEFNYPGHSPAGEIYSIHSSTPGGGAQTIPFMNYGETSPTIRRMQLWFNTTFPLYSHIDPVSGYYGDQTTAVVAEFQKRTRIVGGDGRNIGPRTRAALWQYGFRG